MFHWIINTIKKDDTYLDVLYTAAFTILSVFIYGFIYLFTKNMMFLVASTIGFLFVGICNLPMYKNKLEKIQALVYFTIISMFAFTGVILFNISNIIMLTWFFILTIILYVTTIKRPIYKIHVGIVLLISTTIIPISNGTVTQAINIIISLFIVASIALVLTVLYPERYIAKVRHSLGDLITDLSIFIHEPTPNNYYKYILSSSPHFNTFKQNLKSIDKDTNLVYFECLYNIKQIFLHANFIYYESNNLQIISASMAPIINKDIKKICAFNIEKNDILRDAINHLKQSSLIFITNYKKITTYA